MAKGLKFSFLLLVVILSCSQSQKENLIIGKWIYHHTENGGREDFTVEDSLRLTEQPKGFSVEFFKGNKVLFQRPPVIPQTPSQYNFINGGAALEIQNDSLKEKDTVNIISITNNTLKISADRLVLVFNKQNK